MRTRERGMGSQVEQQTCRYLGELLVPADSDFRTDLTSVPALFTWLVPKTGAHLPAALLHDALVAGRDDPTSDASTDGHEVDRVTADRIFRDAMAEHRHRCHPPVDRLDRGDR